MRCFRRRPKEVPLPIDGSNPKFSPGALAHRTWLELAGLDLRWTGFCMSRLKRRNRSETGSVLSADGPVVSMTSYGKRVETVYLTLESIARGELLPRRLILWLDDEAIFRKRPDSLRRLEARGLEVKLGGAYGPHTKYYPYLESADTLNAPLVTADDDTLYPARWLRSLAEGFLAHPTLVSCCRAHTVRLEGPGFAPYVAWKRCRSTSPSVLNFATGVSGVIYPPALQRQLKEVGRDFVELCPKADDVWLHVQALRGGFRVAQLRAWEQSFPNLPGTQSTGLIQGNVHGSQNDVQIRRTYTSADIELLAAACGNSEPELESGNSETDGR